DYLDLNFIFSRNLPVNVAEEADENVKLKGLISERTRLGRLSFVNDVDYELDEMAQDALNDGFLEPEPSIQERVNINLDELDEDELTQTEEVDRKSTRLNSS